jgi:hypothetical protein
MRHFFVPFLVVPAIAVFFDAEGGRIFSIVTAAIIGFKFPALARRKNTGDTFFVCAQ